MSGKQRGLLVIFGLAAVAAMAWLLGPGSSVPGGVVEREVAVPLPGAPPGQVMAEEIAKVELSGDRTVGAAQSPALATRRESRLLGRRDPDRSKPTPGEISGRVELPDGTLLKKVTLSATAIDSSPATDGGIHGDDITREGGLFVISGLSARPFQLSAYHRGELPILSSPEAMPGDFDRRVVVDAVLVEFLCPGGEGPVPTGRLKLSRHGPLELSLTKGTRVAPNRGAEQLFRRGDRWLITASLPDGRKLETIIDGTLPAGRHSVVMSEVTDEPATLTVVLEGSEALKYPSLMLDSVTRDGFKVVAMVMTGVTVAGDPMAQLEGLRPGQYRVLCSIDGGGLYEATPRYIELELGAGQKLTRRCGVFEGGKVILQATAEPVGSELRIIEVELTPEGGGDVVSAWCRANNGLLPREQVLAPGIYQVRFFGKGLRDAITEVTVVRGEAVRAEVVMVQAP